MLSNLKPYPEYKESGLPWLGRVPRHWELTPNRGIIRRRKVLVGKRHDSYQLLSLTKSGVIVRNVASGKGKFSADMGTSQEVRKGDLVFCLFDVPETPRTVGLSSHNGMITGAYTVFECPDPKQAEYFELFYRAMDDRKLLSPLYSGLRNTIPPGRFLGTKTPQPLPEEQMKIVRFLEWAHGRLDRAIRVKVNLITLLTEQKQAIIHTAVTRGLSPSVALKPSDIPWLGDIPSHWETLPLKRIAWFKSGAGFPVQEQGKQGLEIPFLKVSDMTKLGNKKWIESSNNTISNDTAARLGAFVFPAQTILFPKVGGALLTNKRSLLRRPSCIDNNMMGCVIARGNPDFVFLLFQQLDFGRLSKPGPVPAISESEVREIKIALPPLNEQSDLVSFVEAETETLEAAIVRIEREIALIAEFRATLFADVVTGQVDVRGASIPNVVEPEPEIDVKVEREGFIKDEPAYDTIGENNAN